MYKIFLKEYEGFSFKDGGRMSFKAERTQKERFYVLLLEDMGWEIVSYQEWKPISEQ